MVLVLSTGNDHSTYHIVDWLLYWGVDYVIITPETKVEIIELHSDGSMLLNINDRLLNSEQVTSSWYRRGEITYNGLEKIDKAEGANNNNSLFDAGSFCKREFSSIINYIYYWLKKMRFIDSILHSKVNKLMVLDIAESLGLKIPEWAILSAKDAVIRFREKKGSIITKPSSSVGYCESKDYYFFAYTEEVDDGFIKQLKETFTPSFFQKKVEKRFEIRSFYLNGKLYSMAIFSQENEQTKVDFRKYDKARPNRKVPFNLPQETEVQLVHLAKQLSLTSCSFDLIYDLEGHYYFLEVNPVGQFGMTSIPCNYSAEREIAKYLAYK